MAAAPLGSVLRAAEIVSSIGLIMFGLGDAWGFIPLLRNCLVCTFKTKIGQYFETIALAVSLSACVSVRMEVFVF